VNLVVLAALVALVVLVVLEALDNLLQLFREVLQGLVDPEVRVAQQIAMIP